MITLGSIQRYAVYGQRHPQKPPPFIHGGAVCGRRVSESLRRMRQTTYHAAFRNSFETVPPLFQVPSCPNARFCFLKFREPILLYVMRSPTFIPSFHVLPVDILACPHKYRNRFLQPLFHKSRGGVYPEPDRHPGTYGLQL